MSLPLVVAAVQADESITVTVDGVLLMQGPIARDALGRVLSAIADDRQSPIRAEVRESDGRIFADIITPPPPRPAFAPPPAMPQQPSQVPPPVPAFSSHPQAAQTAPQLAPAPTRRPVGLLEVYGQGFVPGEDVAVAIIVSHTSAARSGCARSLLEADRIAGDVRRVLLFGEVSGTIVRQGAQP